MHNLTTFKPTQNVTNSWRSIWLVLVVWFVTYCWYLFYWYTWYSYNQIDISWFRLALLGILDWAFWLFTVPFILLIAKHHPPVKPKAALLIHLPISLLCALGAVSMSSAARVLLEPIQQDYSKLLITRLYSEGNWYFLFYWFVIGAFFAIDYFKAYRQSEFESLQLQLDNEQLQRGLIEARLQTLKGQLQPHFLFNALHSVSALMETSVPLARAMLIDLAELLRLALKISERDSHSLEEEFDWLEKYLKLEGIRYAGQLNWSLELESNLKQESIPCLLLQPLIENALKHGAKGHRESPIQINVYAIQHKQHVSIKVIDNGIGLTNDALVEGYGLRYIRHVIATHINPNSQLTLENHPNGGVTASILWPVKS